MDLEQKARYSAAKRTAIFMGLTMLVYYMLLNVVVSVVCAVDALLKILPTVLEAPAAVDLQALASRMARALSESMLSNYWGYIAAIGIGLLILLLWKKKTFWKQEIFARSRKMTADSFFLLLLFTVGIQALPQLMMPALEWLLNKIGLSAMTSLEFASMTGNNLSMLLYAGFIGPFAEEILFRGLVLRSFKPHGKQLAIFASAFMFAMFHGNLAQIPYAFTVGLLFGYIALEYSILWAIVYHVFNNFVLADLLSRLTAILPAKTVDTLTLALIYGCALAAVAVGILRRKEIGDYLRKNPLSQLSVRAFFTSPTVLIFSGMMLLSSVLLLFL